jgi:glycosyltransferase involved in cell wall biosynthesis
VTRPLRTLLFSTLYPSSVRPLHGIFVETRLRELLSTGEVETRVVAPVPWFPSTDARWGDYARWAQTPARETWHGVDVLHPRYPLIPKFGMTSAPLLLAWGAWPGVRRLLHEGFDFDLIDAHYYYPDGVAATLLARWCGKPLAITARGTDLNLIPEHALPRRMIRWAARRAQASIGVCAALTDVLRDMGADPTSLHVFRNGVDLHRFTPRPAIEARAKLGLADAPVLLSVGHLIERKGHHLCIAALPTVLEKYPRAVLLIVGEGPEGDRLRAQAQALGLADRVHFAGSRPNEELAWWYSAADLLLLASSREGWANVLLEAMACGTPVVATRIWGTPEVVADAAVGVLVDRRDAGSLADAALALLRQPRDRHAIRAYAEGFSWESTSQQQLTLFRRLRQQKATPHA